MRPEAKELLATLVGYAIVLGTIIAVGWGFNAFRCHAAWSDSGYEVRWRPISGCQLKLDDGGWVPATAARVSP